MLKLDIEGAETNALMGARVSLAAGLFDFILLEVEPYRLKASGHSGDEIDSLLAAYNYVPVAYIRNEAICGVTAATRLPGSFSADYLYVREPLLNSATAALFRR
jgi:hypothetical protein